jgi:hypothetical protein
MVLLRLIGAVAATEETEVRIWGLVFLCEVGRT